MRGPAAIRCPRCGRPIARTRAGRPAGILKLSCARCRFLIYDYPRPCVGFVVTREDQVLVLRRAHPPRVGRLDVPGGFLEAGEDIEAAARRELREETGLTVGRAERLGLYWDRYYLRGFGYIPTLNFYFLARWRSGVAVADDDAASAEWVRLSGLRARDPRYSWKHMGALFRDARRAREKKGRLRG